MRKLIDKIFIYAYTWHYENKYSDSDPIRMASSILGVSIGLWLVAINCALSFIFKYNFKSVFIIAGIATLSLIVAGLLNSFYIENNRALNLYSEYKSSLSVKSPATGILIVVLFMLIPLVLLLLFILFF